MLEQVFGARTEIDRGYLPQLDAAVETVVVTNKPGKPVFKVPLKKDHKELSDIRKQLRLTLLEFASHLGDENNIVKGDRLASYLYGKTDTVPAWVMDSARRLLAESQSASGPGKEVPVKELLAEWKERLACDDTKLAHLLGVSPAVFKAWIKKRPPALLLMEYSKTVDRIAAFLKD